MLKLKCNLEKKWDKMLKGNIIKGGRSFIFWEHLKFIYEEKWQVFAIFCRKIGDKIVLFWKIWT